MTKLERQNLLKDLILEHEFKNQNDLVEYLNQKGNEYPEYSIIGAALLNSFIEGNVAYNTTNMIPVESGQNYISSVPLRVLSYFNEYLVFVGFVSSQINANTPFAIPNGVKYITASILTDYWFSCCYQVTINNSSEILKYQLVSSISCSKRKI